MAIPIAETPILSGDEAIHFLSEIEEAEDYCVSEEEYPSAQKVFHTMEKDRLAID